jgi:hypothetical protein
VKSGEWEGKEKTITDHNILPHPPKKRQKSNSKIYYKSKEKKKRKNSITSPLFFSLHS